MKKVIRVSRLSLGYKLAQVATILAGAALVMPCFAQQPNSQSVYDQYPPNYGDSAAPGSRSRDDLFPSCVDEFGNPQSCYSPAAGLDGVDGYGGLDGYGPARAPMMRIPGAGQQLPPGYYSDTYPNPGDRRGSVAPYRMPPPYERPEPLTEFQRYVAASIGQVLPVFGASLFRRVPASFAPMEHVPVNPDYVIGPGDELRLTVWGQVNFSRLLTVDPSGSVYLPEVGRLALAGLKYSDTVPVIKSGMDRVYKNFELSVAMDRLRAIQVFIMGEVRHPGSYTVSSLSTLVNAIFESGGPSAQGSMRRIQLKRGSRTFKFDLYDLLVSGDKSKDMGLAQGDVILIPSAGPRVAIAGSVERPGIYELDPEATFGDVLQLAGGLSPVAAVHDAVLERVANGAALAVQRIPINAAGLKTKIENGDIVRLIPVVPRFENAVTLRGNVADPGRFPWRPGMRVSDLIPSPEILLTRAYWSSRNDLLGTPETDRTHTEKSQPAEQDQNLAPQQAREAGQPDLQTAGWNGAKPVRALDGALPNYREQARMTQSDASLGAATGSDDVPPVRHFLPTNIVQPSAPEVNWDYAVIERLDTHTLATHLIPFNLGKVVLEHDRSADPVLEPGDVVTIFSKADFSVPRARQTRQVRLEGEIGMAGVYTVRRGETLRSLIARAGGLTANAYLYGAQFTRESTRREQQKRYDDFLNQLEKDVNQGAANLSGRVISPEQAATAQASIASQRELLDRLRRVPVNGRIVLNLDPNSHGIDALPDLTLENGDRLYVPSRPSTVNVVGSVYEQAAFLYDEDLHVGDYLKKAGGPTHSADAPHEFVIRADGSVVARAAKVAMFSNKFDSLGMHPGDTLVVPTRINRTTFVRGLMDWSQVFSNLALGAAAVNVLH